MTKTLHGFILLAAVFAFGSANAQTQCYAKYVFSKTEQKVVFYDSSKAKNTYQRLWDFGDGAHSDSQNPTHFYNKAGNYRVCLLIKDTAAKCVDTFCETVTITTSCKSEWSFSVSGKMLFFVADSSLNKSSAKYRWTFGDGTSTYPYKKGTHSFASAGTYEVCLTVVDSLCEVKTCKQVKIELPCSAKWEYSISGKTVTFRADTTVNKSRAKYRWKFGDGSSIVTGKSASHTYSGAGTFEACLTVIDSPCESHLCKNVVIPTQKYCISGKIDCGGSPCYPGKVWLIVFNRNDSSLKAVMDKSISHDSTGSYYEFCGVEPGKYYVKAALDSSSSYYENYVPTYFENAVKWKKADSILVKTANVTGRNIHMKNGNNSGGPGFIKGKISQGANKKEGDPLAGIEVMLLDNSTEAPVRYTYTNLDGEYSFTNLVLGTYQVYPEVLSLPTIPAIVTLTSPSNGAEGIDMQINSTSVYRASGIVEDVKNARRLALYPNPANDMLQIVLELQKTSSIGVAVYDIAGRKVYANAYKSSAGNQTLQVPVAAFAKGMYTVHISTTDGQIFYGRFAKE
jgi:PKD repeat protein